MRRLPWVLTVAIIAATLVILLASCTPAEIAAFRTLSPDDQGRVLAALGAPEGHSGGDCYSALGHFSGSHSTARRIIWRESRNTPSARNPSGAAGCFQLMPVHNWRYSAVGCSPAQWANPGCNVKAADHLYRSAGWRPWS